VIIGAGLGGLSAAAHLARRGVDVTVLERDPVCGGKAGRVQMGGYTFDTGPTVLTMPGILRDTFAAADADLDTQVKLVRLDPVYRATFADGSSLRVHADAERMTQEIRENCSAHDADAFGEFRAWLCKLNEVEMTTFIDRNYDSPLDLARSIRPLVTLARMGGFGTLDGQVAGRFHDERLRRLFTFQALYAGLAPQQALALFGLITYMDSVEGAWFPEGGIHEVASALARSVVAAGVEVRCGVRVTGIELARPDGGAVRGVRTHSGEFIPADCVVCNADVPVAYAQLLPQLATPRRVARAHPSPSAVVWHAGVRGRPDVDAAHHNIHFGASWEPAFRALITDRQRMPDPSILVTVPTQTDPSLAPRGASTLYALEPVPNLRGSIDWSSETTSTRDDLRARLSSLGYPTDAEVEMTLGPLEWRDRGCADGTPFSAAHRFFQSGPFRTSNVDRRAPGLVFVGAGTVPGVGVPMVLLSGRLAALRAMEVLRS
jgi:phytoene desaturase